MKVYTSKSQVSINIKTQNGYSHINFSALTAGGSIFYTDDEEIQKGIESHPRYGKLFKFSKELLPKEESAEEMPKSKAEKGVSKIKVTDLNEAKDYLCEQYGVSRTKLRSKQSIEAAAAERGIQFDFE